LGEFVAKPIIQGSEERPHIQVGFHHNHKIHVAHEDPEIIARASEALKRFKEIAASCSKKLK